MCQHGHVVELFADDRCVLIVSVLCHKLYKRMVGVQRQCDLAAKHGCIHACHAVHSHHLLHTAALLGQGDHGSHLVVFQFLHFHVQLVIFHNFAECLHKSVRCLLESLFVLFFYFLFCIVRNVRVNALELQVRVSLLKLGDERRVDVVVQDHRILPLVFKHVNVLALLLLVRYIVDGGLGLFLLLLALLWLLFFLLGVDELTAVCLHALFQRHVFVIQVLEEDIVHHLVAEFLVLQAAELDERADVIPVFLVVLLVSLAHAAQLVGNLLGNVVCDLVNKSIVLQRAS